MLVAQVARVTFLTGAGMVVSSTLKTIGGTFGAIGKTATYMKNSSMRKVDLADKRSESQHLMGLMDLKCQQREALIGYGEKTQAQRDRWNNLSENIQTSLTEWDNRFPTL